MMKTRFLGALAVALVGMSAAGLAQNNGSTFKVKSTPTKERKSAALPLPKSTASAATSNAKSLQAAEHQSIRVHGAPKTAAKKSGPALKPVKDKANPPINFGGSGGGKVSGTTNQAANPYKGRVRQKHAHQ
ncbi:MAG: hypothetical protein WAM89_06030 [Terriglobales bacterium]